MADPIALKEWAVTVRALAEGRQIVLLRKGGIGEKRFTLPHRRFFLYPTYEHQRPELLKPPFRPYLEALLAEPWDPQLLALGCWAEVAEAYGITEEERLAALAPHYIWTEDYAQQRLHWRPKEPLLVLLVRAYRLPEAVVLPRLPQYDGCVSWVPLETDVTPLAAALAGKRPVLDDAAFAARAQPVRAALAGCPLVERAEGSPPTPAGAASPGGHAPVRGQQA